MLTKERHQTATGPLPVWAVIEEVLRGSELEAALHPTAAVSPKSNFLQLVRMSQIISTTNDRSPNRQTSKRPVPPLLPSGGSFVPD